LLVSLQIIRFHYGLLDVILNMLIALLQYVTNNKRKYNNIILIKFHENVIIQYKIHYPLYHSRT